jgi:hypothetical protein
MKNTVEIVITSGRTGLAESQQILQIPPDSVQPLIEQIEAMIAHFPPKQVKIAEVTRGSTTFIDIEVGMPEQPPPTRPGPTFETLYRANGLHYPDGRVL